LLPLFGQKTGFRARMNEIKSGIPCSGYTTSRRQLDPILNESSFQIFTPKIMPPNLSPKIPKRRF
jgi:hypothetical protein